MKTTRIYGAALLLAATLSLQGCGGAAQAAATDPEIEALKARVAALEAAGAGTSSAIAALRDDLAKPQRDDLVVGSPLVAVRKASAVGEVAAVGTLVGYVSAGGRLEVASELVGASASGYLFRISAAPLARTPVSLAGPIWYETSNCSGQGYVSGSGSGAVVGQHGAAQGFVFRIGSGPGNSDVDDPAAYHMVRAGADDTTITVASHRSSLTGCTADPPGAVPLMFPVEANDPGLTFVPSGPWEGRVSIGAGS